MLGIEQELVHSWGGERLDQKQAHILLFLGKMDHETTWASFQVARAVVSGRRRRRRRWRWRCKQLGAGPHQISFRPAARNVPLQASMAVTDEPGYYEDGKFGVRLENVLIVKEADTKFNFGDKGYLQFEHITWAPYQSKLIDVSLLVPEEIEWLNNYHSRCREILAPYLNTSEIEWLRKATEPIVA